MTRNETAAAFLRAEYGPDVTDQLITEVVAELSDAELDAIEAAVEAQPHLIKATPPLHGCDECGAAPGEPCREFNCQGTWI